MRRLRASGASPRRPPTVDRRRLLEPSPTTSTPWTYLADYHFRRDEPAEALEYALRARALRPLDRTALQTEWACRVALARQHALDGRWDEGRAEFEAAERLDPELSRGRPLRSPARRPSRLKAGQPERGPGDRRRGARAAARAGPALAGAADRGPAVQAARRPSATGSRRAGQGRCSEEGPGRDGRGAGRAARLLPGRQDRLSRPGRARPSR